jgi:hypothetical protein
MSPEELPGWSYLSRGTNNQALSEGNNEYKLEAARDVGIRPLLAQFEDFLNQSILPLFDDRRSRRSAHSSLWVSTPRPPRRSRPSPAGHARPHDLRRGLGEGREEGRGQAMGGEFPLNPQYQAILDKYSPSVRSRNSSSAIEGASKDPQWAYVRDPFWFQWQQLQMQAQQQQQQQQAQAQQQQQGNVAPPDDDGGGGGGGAAVVMTGWRSVERRRWRRERQADAGDRPRPRTRRPRPLTKSSAAGDAGDLSTAADQALGALSKAEKQLPPSKRRSWPSRGSCCSRTSSTVGRQICTRPTKDVLDVADRLKPKA